MKSSSEQIAAAVRDQKVFDCNRMRPDPIPSVAQDVINSLPPKLEGETEIGYETRLTPQQRGIYAWFNKETGEGKRWQVYCAV